MPFVRHLQRVPFRLTVGILLLLGVALPLLCFVNRWADGQQTERTQPPLDPAAWGSDHVGRPVPEYMTGDECLFCHRDIGKTWSDNRHQQSMRAASDEEQSLRKLAEVRATREFAAAVQLVMGRDRGARFLKRNNRYGRFDLLTAGCVADTNKEWQVANPTNVEWEGDTFAESCAGCHTTGVDPKSAAFSSPSLDCYTCHGDVNSKHTNDTALVVFGKNHKLAPRQVVAICGQCHIRTGRSKRTKRPYPTNFVAGDNLFRDFQVDFSDAALNRLNPIDRHVLHNVRDVVVNGRTSITCLSCHQVHGESKRPHQELGDSSLCATCHQPGKPKAAPPAFRVRSRTCRY